MNLFGKSDDQAYAEYLIENTLPEAWNKLYQKYYMTRQPEEAALVLMKEMAQALEYYAEEECYRGYPYEIDVSDKAKEVLKKWREWK